MSIIKLFLSLTGCMCYFISCYFILSLDKPINALFATLFYLMAELLSYGRKQYDKLTNELENEV